MTLPPPDGTRNWIGRTVVDRNGAEIGVCASLLEDTATGQPEWISVERGEVTVIVPLLDARERGGQVHVTVTRSYADGAPRFGPTQELTRDQEAALYRHYGIEYTASTSDSLLPAEARPAQDPSTGAGSTGDAPAAVVGQHAAGAPRRGPAVAAAVAVLLGLAGAVVAAVRLRRGATTGSGRLLRRRTPPPTPAARRLLAVRTSARAGAVRVAAAAGPVVEASGRLARGTASASAASLRRAAVDSAYRTRAVSAAARTYVDEAAARLAPLVATTGYTLWRAVRAGTDSALRMTDAATEAVAAAVPRVAAGTARAGRTGLHAVLTAGEAAGAVPEAVAETGERLEKSWRRVMGRLSLGLGFGAGYVLGARAGRARYEQIKQAAAGVMARPEVQQALERARAAAPAQLQGGIDKLSGRDPGGAGDHAGTTDVDAPSIDETDVAVTPPPPVRGTSGASGTDAPLPDPLIPPAKSGNDPTTS